VDTGDITETYYSLGRTAGSTDGERANSSDGRFGKNENDSIRFTALSELPSTVHTRGSGLWS